MLITFLLLSVPILPIGILGMGVNQIVRGVHKPVVSKYVNDLTSSEIRATTLSFVSLMNNIAAGVCALVFSMFVNNFTPYQYVLILALSITVLTISTYTFIYKRYGIK
jgi:sugar phosphate permease